MTQFLRDLSTFNKEEIKEFLDSFDTVLADGDGVLWLGQNPLPGSVEVINKLKELGKKTFLVTNNTTLTAQQYVDKLEKLSLNLDEDEVVIPTIVAAEYLKERNFRKKAFVLASAAYKQQFELHGIKCSSDIGPDHAIRDTPHFRQEMQNLDQDVGAVIVDFDFNINYMKMMKALMHLRQPDCLFLVGGVDLQVPIQGGRMIIGTECFITALEKLSGRRAVVTGKPSVLIKELLSRRHDIVPERTLMIGDMISVDMKLGTNCGFQKLLVLSGGSKLEDTKEDTCNLPHYYLATLGDLLPLLPSP